MAHLTGYLNIPPMLLNDLVRNGQAEPGSLTLAALVLGGIERIEDMV